MTNIKPSRISGRVPTDYMGLLYYRLSNFERPVPPSKVLYDHLKFPGRNVSAMNAISYLSMRDAIIHPDYAGEDGTVRPEWKTPIKAVTKASYRADWPEFSLHRVLLVSERLKTILEKYEKDNHAYVPMDVESPGGQHLCRAFVMVRGLAIDAVDYVASKIAPTKVYPGGKALWDVNSALPRDEFCYLSGKAVGGRHHFWDEKLGHVWSQDIVREMGDVLPSEFVFVPMGVTR